MIPLLCLYTTGRCGLQELKVFRQRATPNYEVRLGDRAATTQVEGRHLHHGRLCCGLSKVCLILLNASAHHGPLTFYRQLRFPCYTLRSAYAGPYMLLTRAASVAMPMTWLDRSRVHPLSFSPDPARLLPIRRL